MMTSIRNRHCGGLIAAVILLFVTAAVHAQSGPPAPADPTTPADQNVIPVNPTSSVKVVPRVDRSGSLATLIGITPGSVHKIGVGLGVAMFRTLNAGSGGWVSFECLEDNKAGWVKGDKYWINTNNAVFISAPFVTSKTATAPAPAAPASTSPAPKTVKPKTAKP